jgi:hypothetical protein
VSELFAFLRRSHFWSWRILLLSGVTTTKVVLASLFWHVNGSYRQLNNIMLRRHERFGCLTQ